MKKLIFSLSLIASQLAFAQKQTNHWYFGTLAGLDFTSGSPMPVSNGALNTAEGCAAISDVNGNLLFYTDGVKVWNKNNTQMPNGFGLLGDPSTTQSALIVPNPGNANLYYIFTLPAEGSGNFNYSVVDMTLQSGNGDVSVKNTFLKSTVTEKMSGAYHCNGHDIWVMIHGSNNNSFYAYLVTNTGVNAPVVSNTGPVHTDVHGQMKFNTSGTKIACAKDSATASSYVGTVDLFDFDKATGIVSNPYTIKTNHQKAYGVEFSPDDSKLYVTYYDVASNSWISQFNLAAASIQSSEVILGTSSDLLYSLQLGPDHKIYAAKEVTPFLCVVNAPNTLGTASNYVDNAINVDPGGMGAQVMLGLPGFIQSYLNASFPNIPCVIPVSAHIQSSDTVFCKGTCINFTDKSTGSPTSWQWSFPGGSPSSSSAQNPANICFNTAGTYTVRLIVSNGTSSDTTTEQITVNGVTISAGPDIIISPGSSTHLTATGSTAGYTWSPSAGLSATTGAMVTASPTVNTTYVVHGASNGCLGSDTVLVTVELNCNGGVFVPTAFSPNGDGENETECVMGNCIQTMSFAIYDRWGEKVFESTDQKLCWDGVFRGKQMDNAVFVYYLKATLSNGKEITQKGNISLIR